MASQYFNNISSYRKTTGGSGSSSLASNAASGGHGAQPDSLHAERGYLGDYKMKKSSASAPKRRESNEFVPMTYIDSYTQIPEDLFRRMENDANQDRGVHVPKKKSNGDCVLQHTGFLAEDDAHQETISLSISESSASDDSEDGGTSSNMHQSRERGSGEDLKLKRKRFC